MWRREDSGMSTERRVSLRRGTGKRSSGPRRAQGTPAGESRQRAPQARHARHGIRTLSIRLSMRRFTSAGAGWKRATSCRMTSCTSSLCVIALRSFMTRTMHACAGVSEPARENAGSDAHFDLILAFLLHLRRRLLALGSGLDARSNL